MKKYIIAVISAVCLAVCALCMGAFAAAEPVADLACTDPACQTLHVAAIGSKEYHSIQAAVDAAEDGNTITIIRDFDADCSTADVNGFSAGNKVFANIEEKAVTIDLNGKVITVSPEEGELTDQWHVFSVDDNGKLTIKDSSAAKTGTISVTTNGKFHSIAICYADSGALYIEGGNYEVDDTQSSLVYAQHEGNVFVSGGSFTLDAVGTRSNGSPWIFNAAYNDANYITVTGGIYNANVNHQFWETEVYVPKELALKDNNDGTWTVVPSVAYVEEHGMRYPNSSTKPESFYFRETGYASLADAVASANNYSDSGVAANKTNKIILLKDCVVSNTLSINDQITITVDSELETMPTVYWNGSGSMFDIAGGMSLTIDSGIYGYNVTRWCPEDYAAVENSDGLFEVVKGHKVSYYAAGLESDTLVHMEGVAANSEGIGFAKGYTRIDTVNDKAIFDWFAEKDTTENTLAGLINFAEWEITDDSSVYGSFAPAIVVEFNSVGGSNIEAQAFNPIAGGAVAKEPADPEKTGFTFDGWYTEPEMENAFVFVNGEKEIESSVTLYAKWLVNRTVSFETNGGREVEPITIGDGKTLENAPTPTRSGYSFAGWYRDPELTEAYDFSTPVESNITLYAKWNKIPPRYPVNSSVDGLAVSPANARYGETVTVTVEEGKAIGGIRVTDRYGNSVNVVRDGDTYTFKMPSSAVTIVEIVNPFEDISHTDYFYDAILWAAEKGITNGVSDTSFAPGVIATRAMFWTMLARIDGVNTEPAEGEDWWAKGMDWMMANGFTDGTMANGDVTREQIVTMLWRYAQSRGMDVSVGEDTNILSYEDAFDISEYAIPAMQWACGEGIITDSGTGLLDPLGNATRYELVTMLMRFFEML